MIQTHRYEKCCNTNNCPNSSEWEVVKKLIPYLTEGQFYIGNTYDVYQYLEHTRNIKYFSMDFVEDNQKYEIDEWEEYEHTLEYRYFGEEFKGITP
jgi:hypothetical protein